MTTTIKKFLFPMSTPGSNWRHFNSMTNFDKTWLELRRRRSAKAHISRGHDHQWAWSAVGIISRSHNQHRPWSAVDMISSERVWSPSTRSQETGISASLHLPWFGFKFDKVWQKKPTLKDFLPWHRNIPSWSKMFKRQWRLEKPGREVLDDTWDNHVLPGRDAQ